MFDGIIFDLDGTLWDSTIPVATAWQKVVTRLGVSSPKEITPASIAGIMGMTHEQIFETFFPRLDLDLREKIAANCYDEEVALLESEGALIYPGVREGLAKLARQFPLFIVSNCQAPYLESFFSWSKMRPLFKDNECHGNTGKPKAENLMAVVKRNELLRPIYIGDTASDEKAARLAGVPYLHVNYGFGNPTESCTRFDDFNSLVNFFLPSPTKGVDGSNRPV